MSILLREQALTLLRAKPSSMTYDDIAEATGLSLHWLKSFSTGKIRGASVDRVQSLYEYLSGQKLFSGAN